jgi:beta-phosphoglucomutase-like phosphatase (HAD superfamily)
VIESAAEWRFSSRIRIDGTLVDSVDLHAEAWRVAFQKFGKTIGFAEVRRQIGKGAE